MINKEQVNQALEIAHSGFFALRTPLLPIDELTRWSGALTAAQAWEQGKDANALENAWKQDVQTLRRRLLDILARPEVVHALYVASPALQSGIEHWKRDPGSKKGIQAERALVRYFVRMAARSTPFGLFSGCTPGRVDSDGESTSLVLKPKSKYRISCRLDFDYLFALTRVLRRDSALEMELQYAPNTSLHKVGDAWHYTESRMSEDRYTHHLVKLESDSYLEAVLARAQGGATALQLVEAVLDTPGEADPSVDEAKAYVLELIRENDILIPNLAPLLTGTPPLDDIIHCLETLPAGAGAAGSLREIRERLSSLEHLGLGCHPGDYEAITSELKKLPAKIDPARLYQVDMIKPAEDLVLGKAVIAELVKGAELLCRLGLTGEPEELKSFRDAFTARYEMALVPLMEALDEDSGIGFGWTANKPDASPLLRGLRLGGGGGSDGKSRPLGVHETVLRQLLECLRTGQTELELDLSGLDQGGSAAAKLANAFCVEGTLAAKSAAALQQGDFEFFLHGAFGPSGARLLGRFCHEDPLIERGVREHLRQEEKHDPEAIYAEIVHLPEGRIGNVLCRPVLRDYEIPYLGRSGAPPNRQLPVGDLLIGVEAGSIVLYSRRLRRRVVPRLTNAHGFLNPQLSSVYRFLCYLQHQHGSSAPGFSWGALNALDHLPRVRAGRLVLSLAQWRLSAQEVEAVGKEDASRRFAAVQNLRQRRGLPRWVLLQEGDNSLPVDLDNALSVDAFVHVLKRGSQARMVEMYPSPDRLCACGPEGHFHHELHVPFVRRVESRAAAPESERKRPPDLEAASLHRESRILPPGSEWLYVKLYGGAGVLDDALTTAVLPLVRRVTASGCVSRWFFIRYSDPRDHLRIRFNGNPARLSQELLPLLAESFNPLLFSAKLSQIGLDTYQREIERYGGREGLLEAEEVFFADSEAVLEILQELAGDEGLDLRWRIGLMGIDLLLSDFGFDWAAKRTAVERSLKLLQAEFKVEAAGKKQLGEKFRAERRELEHLLEHFQDEGGEWNFAHKAFARRSTRNKETVRKLRSLAVQGTLTVDVTELVSNFVHMHINRLIRASQPLHELVLYDFLFQLYDGRLARNARSESPDPPPSRSVGP